MNLDNGDLLFALEEDSDEEWEEVGDWVGVKGIENGCVDIV